jgi:hypothetical protein
MQEFLAKLNLTSIVGIPPNAPIKALADRIIDSYRRNQARTNIKIDQRLPEEYAVGLTVKGFTEYLRLH